MLYFVKHMPLVQSDRAARRWERFAGGVLRGRTLGIVGLGQVGREVARVSAAVGVHVLGVRRTPGVPPDGVAEVFGPRGLHDILERSDFVVLSAPYTADTDTLLDAAAIARMRQGAVLINMARGSLLDEEALLIALRSGHLAGAALDVFRHEPLPSDSPFWDLPNVLITPHSMSTAVGENDLLVDLFCDNLRRYLDGQPLRNLVDKHRGY
jgi:glyoxylate/hydroxypyruvate reductase A